MSLAPGTRLGAFLIVGPLGAGGMGEVYRARDTRLHREVAVKILPSTLASDADRIARFTREAQTLAALNHPAIAQIFGVEESDTTRALVMELVEGETLAERLARGPVPLDEVLPMACQIADALEAAHEAGIIHRDLKPANIKLRPDGSIKVLDFGLAKGIDRSGGASPRGHEGLLDSPTLTSPAMTQAGMILGTASYMSPEQAKGRPVDRRADIWAFGCVLFEMLAGRTLFAADSVTETLARVLEGQPDLSALPHNTPPPVRALIARCLHRDPRQRLRDIGEARVTLEHPLTASPQADVRVRTWHRGTLAALLATTAAIAAAAAIWVMRSTAIDRPPAPRRLALATPGDAPPLLASISPDGSAILVIAGDKLWLQKLDSFTATEVPGSEGAHAPFWSPDGAAFGFQARGQLWRAGRDGSAPVGIGRVPEFTFAGGAAWLPDGRVIYTTGSGGLLQIPAAGGASTAVRELDPATETDIHNVSALPDGQSLIYVLHPTSGPWSIELFDLRDSSRRTLYTKQDGVGLHHAVYSTTGHVLFEQPSGVWALPISGGFEPAGTPFLVAPDARQPAIAADGTLVMLPGGGPGADAGLAWIDRAGAVLQVVAEPRGSLFNPRVSPDGRFAAVARGAGGDADLWIHNLERGSERRLTFEDGPDVLPVWSPRGDHLVYQCQRTVCARRADGAGPRVELLEAPASEPALSPDGKWLTFVREVTPGDTDIFVVALNDSGFSTRVAATARALISGPRMQARSEISPDGRYIAYQSSEGGPSSVFVSQFPSGQGKWQVPLGYANWPRWSARGDRLYVLDELARIIELPVDRARLFDVGAPVTRIPANGLLVGGYDRSPDDTRFLVPISSTGALTAARLLVVQHWRPEAR